MIRRFGWLSVLLLLLSLFLTVGYAALTDNPMISGDATVEARPFVGVYIFEVAVYSRSNGVTDSFAFYKPTAFTQTVSTTRVGVSITYKITFHNNSDVTYWYIGRDFMSEVDSNSLIGQTNGITITTKDHPEDTYETFNEGDWIPPHTYRDVYVTYTYGSNATGGKTTLVNFLFGLHMDSIHDKFLVALNDSTPGGGYDIISEAFDEQYRETGSRVISNVGEEKEMFDRLFGENLTITVDDQEVPVTVMVRRENVDARDTGDDYIGGSGCEYSVYITVDPLDSPTGEALVYVVSYSNGGVGGSGDSWYQLGQLYEGTAKRVDYDSTEPGVQGAFDPYSWVATPNRYEAADDISYLVGQEQGDQYDKLKTLEQILSTGDQDIFNDIDNSRIFKKVYDIINNSANTSKPGYSDLRAAFYAASPFYNIYNNGQEIKVKRTSTRAEIIPYLEAIQKALDYYNEVN